MYLAQDLRVPGKELPRPGVLQQRGVRGKDGRRRQFVSTVLDEGPDGLRQDGGERSVAARDLGHEGALLGDSGV